MAKRDDGAGPLGLLAAGGLLWLGWRAWQRRDPLDMAGRVVLVTGGSRGLGLALAREFAARGCRLVICSRDPGQLAEARRDLEARGAETLAVPCDVADEAQVREMVEAAVRRFGRIDVLVNNASVIQVMPFESATLDHFRQAMEVNFWGTVHATLAVLPGMRARGGGRIVNIDSIGGAVSLPHMMPYGCAKFATRGFSEGLRAEAAKDGIRVTTILPGLVRTGSQANVPYRGKPELEFAWFTLAGATSLTSTSAERAARRIVDAARHGEAEVVLTWQAKLLRLAHGLAPALTQDVLGVVNRALPDGAGPEDREEVGMRMATRLAPSALTTQANRAARELHQYAGNRQPSPEHARGVGLEESRS